LKVCRLPTTPGIPCCASGSPAFGTTHGGGTVPFLIYRMGAMNNRPQVNKQLVDGTVGNTLRRLYYDVAEI
jgi:hypothetical protein